MSYKEDKEEVQEAYEYSKKCAEHTARAGENNYSNVKEYANKLKSAKGL